MDNHVRFIVPTACHFQKNYYFTNCHTISTDMVFLARSCHSISLHIILLTRGTLISSDMVFLGRSCHSISSHIVILTRGPLMLYSFNITRTTTWNMNVLVLYLITSSIKCRHQWCELRHVLHVHVYNKTSKSQTCRNTIIYMDTLSWVKDLQILTVYRARSIFIRGT